MPFVISTLLVFAVAATLLALALFMNFLSLGPGAAPTSPPPTNSPTLQPSPTVLPTAEPTVEPTPTPRPSGGGTHIVAPGESLSTIGELYGVPWQLIAEINDIPEPYIIRVGQELIIPASGAQPSGDTGIHIVAPGESIISIAELYGIDPTVLADANEIADWNLIIVGQRLVIPDSSATPEASATP